MIDQGDDGDDQLIGASQRVVQVHPNIELSERKSAMGSVAHDRRNGDDPGEEVDPAGEPRVATGREVLRPLEHRTCDGVVTRELGEVERHEELTDRDDRPGPEQPAADVPTARDRTA